jgi:peptidoglycan hydrolase-like protein with peptidoglycan-binding domain
MAFRSLRFAGDPTLEAAASNAPALCKGAKGPAVAAIQQALVDLGYPMPISMATSDSTPDGIFGDETTATVKQFQKEVQLTADGIVGRNTIRALDEHSAFADLRPVRDTVE